MPMLHSRIVGTGSYVPERVVGNSEVSPSLERDPDRVFRLTGIKTRHWAPERQASSDLATEAARNALDAAGRAPSSVDAILVSTTSPDTAFPSTACYVQRALGARAVAAFDLAASCSGFLYGLSMADAMIRSGQARCCLVIAAEVKSRFLDRQDDATAMLFGDGAGAATVVGETSGNGQGSGILGVRLYADGARHALIQVAAGGSRIPGSSATIGRNQHVIRMQGGPLFRIAVRRLETAIRATMKEFGVGLSEVKRVVVHQANGRILAALRDRLGLPPEALYSVIERFGNASSASLPIALDRAVRDGHIAAGDLVLLGAFGGGLTWATALLRW